MSFFLHVSDNHAKYVETSVFFMLDSFFEVFDDETIKEIEYPEKIAQNIISKINSLYYRYNKIDLLDFSHHTRHSIRELLSVLLKNISIVKLKDFLEYSKNISLKYRKKNVLGTFLNSNSNSYFSFYIDFLIKNKIQIKPFEIFLIPFLLSLVNAMTFILLIVLKRKEYYEFYNKENYFIKDSYRNKINVIKNLIQNYKIFNIEPFVKSLDSFSTEELKFNIFILKEFLSVIEKEKNNLGIVDVDKFMSFINIALVLLNRKLREKKQSENIKTTENNVLKELEESKESVENNFNNDNIVIDEKEKHSTDDKKNKKYNSYEEVFLEIYEILKSQNLVKWDKSSQSIAFKSAAEIIIDTLSIYDKTKEEQNQIIIDYCLKGIDNIRSFDKILKQIDKLMHLDYLDIEIIMIYEDISYFKLIDDPDELKKYVENKTNLLKQDFSKNIKEISIFLLSLLFLIR